MREDSEKRKEGGREREESQPGRRTETLMGRENRGGERERETVRAENHLALS